MPALDLVSEFISPASEFISPNNRAHFQFYRGSVLSKEFRVQPFSY